MLFYSVIILVNNIFYKLIKNYYFKIITMGIGDWGLGIGDWGLGIGPNPQSPIPNPQSPNPQCPCLYYKILNYLYIIQRKINLNFNSV
jgi:hypothetical protein